MLYNDIVCDGCKEIMHSDDDIVVCPICGTPQHRECYNLNNCCVNEALHSDSFEWKAPETSVSQNEQSDEIKPDENANSEPTVNTTAIPLFPSEEQLDTVYMRGVSASASDDLDGVKVGEAAVYLQNSSGRYISKFMKKKGKKNFVSWNWAAFFFSPYWFFYRKMYKTGAIFLALIVAVSLAFSTQQDRIDSVYDKMSESLTEMRQAQDEYSKDPTDENEKKYMDIYSELMQEGYSIMPLMGLIFLFYFLVPNTIAALIANSVYKKKMLNDINMAHKGSEDKKVIRLSLLRSGGVSFFVTLGSIIVASYLPSIILSVINMIVK